MPLWMSYFRNVSGGSAEAEWIALMSKPLSGKPGSPQIAVFSTLEQLLAICWEYQREDAKRLPDTVYRLPEGAWAVPLAHWLTAVSVSVGHLKGSAARRDWEVKFVAELPVQSAKYALPRP